MTLYRLRSFPHLAAARLSASSPSTKTALLVAFLAAAYPFQAYAAGPDAGSLLNEQRQNQPEAPRRSLENENKLVEPAPVAPSGGNEVTFTLRSVRFSGAVQMVSENELQKVAAPYLGRTLNHRELQQLALDVTTHLRARGFLLARAYLPRQDVTSGTLEIGIVDGRLQPGADRVTVTGNTRISHDRIKAIAEASLPEDALRTGDLERALLRVNDLPGITARSALERGSTAGTSRLLIDATEANPFSGSSVSVDNFTNRTTGDLRGTAQLAVSDPLSLGDDFGTQLSLTSGTAFVGANYSVPITASGLSADASFSFLHYSVSGDLAPLELKGHAYTGAIGAGYPIIRTRSRNLAVHVDYEQKRLRDDGLGTNLRSHRLDHLGIAFVGNNVDSLFGGGITEGSIIFVGGYDDLSGNRSDQLADRFSADIHGQFEKLNWQLARVQSLGRGTDGKWSLYAASSGQLAGGNLDSSEKFILGGPNGVRAYPVGEAPGDIGCITSVELRRDFVWPKKARAQAIAFVDEGHIFLNHSDWHGALVDISHKNEYDLGGAGLGLNVWVGRWAFRLAAAQAIGRNPGADIHDLDADGRKRRQTLWFQTSLTY